ncbi:MAG: ATP-binding domain-containing protein, partial [Thermomicrobiales bacterium]|nr:ATP-binding domain-containing protein [Thermomicrobiales bacterium]
AQRVALMTIHSAKGLEWRVVVLAGVEEGQMPRFRNTPPEALAEERRVLYVGMTRARERLFLLSAESRNGFQAGPARFLEPLLGELIEILRA